MVLINAFNCFTHRSSSHVYTNLSWALFIGFVQSGLPGIHFLCAQPPLFHLINKVRPQTKPFLVRKIPYYCTTFLPGAEPTKKVVQMPGVRLVTSLVEQLQGTITPDRMTGTVFTITIPAEAAKRESMGVIPADINAAIPVRCITNVLVSNSLKHTFPDGKRGIFFIVMDNGVGSPQDSDWRDKISLGPRLVISLVGQLSGTITLDLTKAGTVYHISIQKKSGEKIVSLFSCCQKKNWNWRGEVTSLIRAISRAG